MKKVIVVGGGCSGLTTAIYLKRANFDVDVFCDYGNGNLTTSELVENFPGFPNGISGFQLLNNMVQQCKNFGVNIIDNKVIELKAKDNTVTDDFEIQHKYDILVLATGLKYRKFDLDIQSKFKNVHRCATCDGAFYKNKDVVVVGGGNTALQEALYLSDVCNKVYLIHRREQFRAEPIIVDKVKNKNNIQILYNSKIEQVLSTEGNSKFLDVVKTNNKIINVSAIFLAIGFDANLQLMQPYINSSMLYNNHLTSTEGFDNIYICGDINNKYHQAIIACGDGAKVAMQIIQENK